MGLALTVGAIVLAAGSASRFGAAKLAADLHGIPVLARTLAAIRAADLPILLVTGHHAEAVRAAAADAPTVHAADHSTGLSASLRTGLRSAPPDWTAALICLADMPWVRPETYAALAAALANAPAIYPVHQSRRGNPAGFARAHWRTLCTLTGDQGAGAFLQTLGAQPVEVPDPAIHRDIDRPEDLS